MEKQQIVELFDKLMNANRYCAYSHHGVCDGCPYEEDAYNCGDAIKSDIQTVREAIQNA